MSIEGLQLLQEEKVQEFNSWRMKNLTVKLDLIDLDFGNKNIAGAYLNGVTAHNTIFTKAVLTNVNFVQSSLTGAKFEGANCQGTLFMYTDLKGAKFNGADVKKANFMWANLTGADLSSVQMYETIFVEAIMENAIVVGSDKMGAYLKYAKLGGTPWNEKH